MKRPNCYKLLVVLFLAAGLFSCERLGELYRLSDAKGTKIVQGNDETGDEKPDDPCGEPVIIPLVFKTELESSIGQITVTNDDECLNLTFEIIVGDWEFDQIYLFVGALDDIPLTADPYPAFWDFLTLTFDPAVSSYSHCVPLAELDDCFKILAQVHGVNGELGDAVLWTKGINPGWTQGPFYTYYCIENCKETCDGCKMGIYRTQTPGGWGAKAAGYNPGTYRDANFDGAFPKGLEIGDPDNFTITLSSAGAIERLLPTGGKPAALTQSFTDPASIEIKNVLVGHIVALSLSIGFDNYDEDFGEAEGQLKNLIIADGHGFDGMNVADILDEANIVLGGGSSSYSPSQMTEILAKINEYFVDGKQSEKYKLFDCK
ncbi:MAG: hypothetical protein AMS23_02320 [Bacteroides sp. SM1_62]|nr:MAG: hypothetical protein AMS26_09435 [Bacteroides sp. SM23_62]KPL26324.1 MAG: hypothetical protein AMS23_02320 [Bacteroides sp. SM1_62]